MADKEDVTSIERSLSFDSDNAEAAYRLARLYQLLMIGDEGQAENLYIDSIKHSPLMSVSWLGLTEMYIEAGKDEQARTTLAMTSKLIPSSIGLLWESSLLAWSLGERKLAMDNLMKVAKVDPRRRQRVFDVSWQMIGEPRLILNNVVSNEILGEYLRYLIFKDMQGETYTVWERMRNKGVNTPNETALAYVDYLMKKEDIEEAKRIWAGLYPEGNNDSLIWNGSFEKDSVGRGFDWRIGNPEGADINFDYTNKTKGERSVKITFSGENNINFHHLRQTVPVEPDSKYLFSADISTRDITTRDGVRWQVYCKGMNKLSEIYVGTVEWTTSRIPFVTPSDCNALQIRFIRRKSTRFDNLISGEAWIDNVSLFKLGRATDA